MHLQMVQLLDKKSIEINKLRLWGQDIRDHNVLGLLIQKKKCITFVAGTGFVKTKAKPQQCQPFSQTN